MYTIIEDYIKQENLDSIKSAEAFLDSIKD